MVYKLIAFDQGGLLTTTGEVPSRKVFKELGISEEYGLRIWKNYDVDFFGGRMSESEWWHKFIYAAKSRITAEKLKEIFRDNLQPYTENLDFVRRLTEGRTYRTAIWTNNAEEWLEFQKKTFHVDRCVHALVSSHELGVTKHSLKFFDMALKETNKRLRESFLPEEVLFADDDERYVDNARSRGFSAVHIPKPELLSKIILSMGVRV